MTACPQCKVPLPENSRFCSSCGTLAKTYQSEPVQQTPQYSVPDAPHHAASRGFGQMFGLDPRVAFLAFIVDLMLFGTTAVTSVASLGVTLPILVVISAMAGAVIGFITYKAQMRWYGDDREAAAIKGGIVGLLTAIPVGIPAIVWIPSGLLGLVHNLRRK